MGSEGLLHQRPHLQQSLRREPSQLLLACVGLTLPLGCLLRISARVQLLLLAVLESCVGEEYGELGDGRLGLSSVSLSGESWRPALQLLREVFPPLHCSDSALMV